jgi:hypothetical protein
MLLLLTAESVRMVAEASMSCSSEPTVFEDFTLLRFWSYVGMLGTGCWYIWLTLV